MPSRSISQLLPRIRTGPRCFTRRRNPRLLAWIAERHGRHRIRLRHGCQRPIRRRPVVLRAPIPNGVDSRLLISATGVLHHPRIPPIAGLDDFRGRCFTSARWDTRFRCWDAESRDRYRVQAYKGGLAGVAGKSPCSSARHNGKQAWLNPRYRSWACFPPRFSVYRWAYRHIAEAARH